MKLDSNSLAKKVLIQETACSIGLFEECRGIMTQWQVSINSLELYTKHEWKRLVSNNMKQKNLSDLLREMKQLKKINFQEISQETFEIKEYMRNLTYEEALLRFRIRSKVVKTIKTHFKNDKVFSEELWSCDRCSRLDTSDHLLYHCSKYDDLREGLSFDKDEDLVSFFRKVIERRENDDKNDEGDE